jgi:hypothetical protein
MLPVLSFARSKWKLAAILALLFALTPVASESVDQGTSENHVKDVGVEKKRVNVLYPLKQTDTQAVSRTNVDNEAKGRNLGKVRGRTSPRMMMSLLMIQGSKTMLQMTMNAITARTTMSNNQNRGKARGQMRPRMMMMRPMMMMKPRTMRPMMRMKPRTMRPRMSMKPKTMRPRVTGVCQALSTNRFLNGNYSGVSTASDEQELQEKHESLRRFIIRRSRM